MTAKYVPEEQVAHYESLGWRVVEGITPGRLVPMVRGEGSEGISRIGLDVGLGERGVRHDNRR